ncbi:MAG: TolC family protein, partial [Cyclobacteriaceae bacterium]|nr:TolC family protein [Cyclobacteriaceae bacterium]
AINFADYQLAQNNFFNAQADLVTSKYTYIFRVKVLDFYLGNPLKL